MGAPAVEPTIANSEVIADDTRPLKAAVATRPAARASGPSTTVSF